MNPPLLARLFGRRWKMARSIPPDWLTDRWYWDGLVDGYDFSPSPGPVNDWGHTAEVRTPAGIVTANWGDTIILWRGKLWVKPG